MRMKTKMLLSMAFLLSAGLTQAQPWMASVKSTQPTFHEMQTAFNEYWKDRPVQKGEGYKVFKRWEWYWQTRLLADGSFPNPSINRDELLKYRRTHPQTGKIKSANWVFQGPSTSVGGYYGLGRVNTMAFHPTDANTFWVGTPAGGLWKTTDGGVSWSSNTDNLGVLGVSGIAIHPTNTNIMYIATGDGDGQDTYSMGVLKSTDGGNTWNTTGLSFNVPQRYIIRRLVMNPTNPQVLMVATNGGIFRTTDGGVTWATVRPSSIIYSDIEFKPNDPTIVYATGYDNNNGYIYTSNDGGATWSTSATLPGVRRMNLEVVASAPDLVHALGTNASSGFAGLWTSSNSGVLFTQTTLGTSTNNILHSSSNGSGTTGQGNYDLAFAINPSNPNELWVGGVNTWASTDGGQNFTLKNFWNGSTTLPVVHADKHFMVFHPLAPTVLFECNDGGIYKTVDGGANWINLSNGLGISQIYRIGLSVNSADRVLAGLQDNSTKKMINGTWSEAVGTGDGFESIVDYNNPNTMYTSSYYGHILKSTNGGVNWSDLVKSNGTGVHSQGAWLTPYVMHPYNSNTLLVGKSQVYQTTDGGTTWTQLGTLPAFSGNQVRAIAYAPSDTKTIYAATNSSNGNILYKTVDGGANWNPIYTAGQTIDGIAVNPYNPQKLWIIQTGYTGGSKVFTSANGGTTWTNFSGTLPNVPVNCIVYQNGTKDALYIGTDVGVFYRDADDTDWTAFQTGLPNVVVNELEISYSGKKLWAATYGRGLWSTDIDMSCVAPTAPVSGGNVTICQDAAPATLTATPSAGTTIDWYSASTGGTLLQAGSNTLNVSATGNYYAEARNSTTNCKSTTRVLVTATVNPSPAAPTVTASGSTALCNGGSVTLTSSATTGNQWYSGTTAITGATGQTYTANAAGDYNVKVTTGGCTSAASAPTVVTVSSTTAAPTISAGGATTFCNGGSVTLTSSAASNNQWFKDGTAITGATGQTYTANTTGNYTVQTGTSGCLSPLSAATAVTVTTTPTAPTVTTSGTTTFCQGGSVTLTSSATSGNQWYKNGSAISSATNATYVANASGVYTVKATSGACASEASSAITVTVNATPLQPTITQNGGVLQSSTAIGNQWYFNGSALPLNATGQTYTPTATGQYTVVTTVNGCTSPASAPFDFTITSVNSPELDNQIQIAPNPVSHKLTITYKGNPARFQVTLLDLSGKQVLAQGSFTTSYTLNMQGFSAGPYIIRVTNERSKEHVQRVIMKK